MKLKTLALVEKATDKDAAIDGATAISESFYERTYAHVNLNDEIAGNTLHPSGISFVTFGSYALRDSNIFLTNTVIPKVDAAQKGNIDFDAHNQIVTLEAGLEYDRYHRITKGLSIPNYKSPECTAAVLREDPWFNAMGGFGAIGGFDSAFEPYLEMSQMSREEYIQAEINRQFRIGAVIDKEDIYTRLSLNIDKNDFRAFVNEKMETAHDDTWFVIGVSS